MAQRPQEPSPDQKLVQRWGVYTYMMTEVRESLDAVLAMINDLSKENAELKAENKELKEKLEKYEPSDREDSKKEKPKKTPRVKKD